MMAPEIECPECGKTGKWGWHCGNKMCAWLRCQCQRSTYSTDTRTFLVRRPKTA